MLREITRAKAEQARRRIAPLVPVSPLCEGEAGGRFFLKEEFRLPTGSFKCRPALNGVLSLGEEQRRRGVIASSSGNFAQAVAFAAKNSGISAMIVMTRSTSSYKIDRTRQLGAEVVLCEPTFEARWETTYRLQEETSRTLLHPYDSAETVLGDATIGLELLEQLSGDFTVVVPVSGGGLLGGIGFAVKEHRPGCRVLGVQPISHPSMRDSLLSGHPVRTPPGVSVADALVALEPGKLGFALAQKYVDDVLPVSDDEMCAALKWIHSRCGLVVEAAAAATVAVYLRNLRGRRKGTVVCVLSGGNISKERHNELLIRGERAVK